MRVASSYKDPSGFVYKKKDVFYRQIFSSYFDDYYTLMNGGLYSKLIADGFLIPHDEISRNKKKIVIKPKKIEFISYPYEWSFDQLRDAALLTLKIHEISMKHGMTLKDASPYNVQFLEGKPVLIDTLSFERYENNQPWVAYKQFCELFLAPLLLMAKCDIKLQKLLQNFTDGIPLELSSKLLPFNSFFNVNILLHIHLHSMSQNRHSSTADFDTTKKTVSVPEKKLLNIIQNLTDFIKTIRLPKNLQSEWGTYYSDTSYKKNQIRTKKTEIKFFLSTHNISSLWDFGGNNGYFSRVSTDVGIKTICFDIDPVAVNQNYLSSREADDKLKLPLLLDLTNPSSDIGWNNNERLSIIKRGIPDCLMALALIHHLVFSKNIPLSYIFDLFYTHTKKYLIVEYVDKNDEQSLRLLRSKNGVFHNYSYDSFVSELNKKFKILYSKEIIDGKRTLFFCRKI